MKDESQSSEIEAQPSDTTEENRRRLLKGIVAVAPLVTVKSVYGSFVFDRRCSDSGQLSGNVSNAPAPDCSGTSCSAQFWAGSNRQHLWPDTTFTPGTAFDDAFGVTVFGSATLLQVLEETALVSSNPTACANVDDIKAFAREAVAAVLNASNDLVYYFFTAAEVIGIVQDVFADSPTTPVDCATIIAETDDLATKNGNDVTDGFRCPFVM